MSARSMTGVSWLAWPVHAVCIGADGEAFRRPGRVVDASASAGAVQFRSPYSTKRRHAPGLCARARATDDDELPSRAAHADQTATVLREAPGRSTPHDTAGGPREPRLLERPHGAPSARAAASAANSSWHSLQMARWSSTKRSLRAWAGSRLHLRIGVWRLGQLEVTRPSEIDQRPGIGNYTLHYGFSAGVAAGRGHLPAPSSACRVHRRRLDSTRSRGIRSPRRGAGSRR
jgi:hypothetical protein